MIESSAGNVDSLREAASVRKDPACVGSRLRFQPCELVFALKGVV